MGHVGVKTAGFTDRVVGTVTGGPYLGGACHEQPPLVPGRYGAGHDHH